MECCGDEWECVVPFIPRDGIWRWVPGRLEREGLTVRGGGWGLTAMTQEVLRRVEGRHKV